MEDYMGLKTWSKTLLESYIHLKYFAKTVDKLILRLSLNSNITSSTDLLIYNTYVLTDKLISLCERKKVICNTKVLVDEILLDLPIEYSKILILKYIDKLSNLEISKIYNVNVRTIFRKLQIATDKFANRLLVKGYNNENLLKIYNSERWMHTIYLRVYSRLKSDLLREERIKCLLKKETVMDKGLMVLDGSLSK